MGGMGSGGWNNTGRRTTSDAWRLSVDSLNKAGVLASEWPRGWQWSRDGKRVADIRIHPTESGIRLVYRSRLRGGEWADHTEEIARYLCRKCHNLAYPCQRESPVDRAFRRANLIRIRLGGEPGTAYPFPRRPKHMHRRTYNDLEYEYYQAVAEINDYCKRRFGGEFI